MSELQERFEGIARKFIHRDGLEDLLRHLCLTDFYSAPASTRYHDSEEEGLVKHSLRVFSELDMAVDESQGYSMESKAIVALFHDLCKVDYYKKEMRNTKDEKGKWIQVPYYTVEDKLPLGHGEKSVLLIREFMDLTMDEMLAIRWHMGGFEPIENRASMGKAYEMCPLALQLHLADMRATYLD